MKIMMVTNTFTPHVGGVARSVQQFTDQYRKQGHQVCVVAPGAVGKRYHDDINTIRIPAAEDVGGSSFYLPVLTKSMEANVRLVSVLFRPDVIHSHHPFLLGTLARKLSDLFKKPLIFTHHTMYEHYSHVVSKNSIAPTMLKNLPTAYANMCDRVIAPSTSTLETIRSRGVRTPISVLPTGVDIEKFSKGSKHTWRRRLGIPENAAVVGHVGRLAPEKNLEFMASALKELRKKFSSIWFLIVGDGSAKKEFEKNMKGVSRTCFTGSLSGQDLIDAYHSMDVFVFSSYSETQGMVLAEAMATGLPVVALKAPGVVDVLVDGTNGYMLELENPLAFAKATAWALHNKKTLSRAAKKTALEFSQETCARKAVELYKEVGYTPKQNIVNAASFTNSLLKTFLR